MSQVSQMSQHFHSILYFCFLNYTGIEIARIASSPRTHPRATPDCRMVVRDRCSDPICLSKHAL